MDSSILGAFWLVEFVCDCALMFACALGLAARARIRLLESTFTIFSARTAPA